MIWNGTTQELTLFIDEFNKKHKTIKFDYKISTKQRKLLDTTVYIEYYHKKLEHFANITYSSKSI